MTPITELVEAHGLDFFEVFMRAQAAGLEVVYDDDGEPVGLDAHDDDIELAVTGHRQCVDCDCTGMGRHGPSSRCLTCGGSGMIKVLS